MNLETLFETIYEANNYATETETTSLESPMEGNPALFEKIYFECNLKPLFEQVLKEMANYTKTMFIGAFENAIRTITANKDYQKLYDTDKTIKEVILLIINSNPEIHPFAIKYDDDSDKEGKIIVFEKYKSTVEAAARQRMKKAKEAHAIANNNDKKNIAKNDFNNAKKTLEKLSVTNENEIRNWIINTLNNIKVQEYKNTAIDVFMIMYEALPLILTVEQVSTKLNNLPVLPHLGGSVISSH